jgi:hypothetical protein
MQRPPELVPIPESLRKASEGFGKLRKVAAFWKNPENIRAKFSKILNYSAQIWQNLRIFCQKSAEIWQN